MYHANPLVHGDVTAAQLQNLLTFPASSGYTAKDFVLDGVRCDAKSWAEPLVGLYPAAYYAVVLSRESFRCLSLALTHLHSTVPTVWADWDKELPGVSLTWRVTNNGGSFPDDITGFHAGIAINAP